MLDVLTDLERWIARGKRVAIARVVGTEGSSPREPGATMVISELGEVSGSVSGGCVEGAVVSEALALMGIENVVTENGTPREISASAGEACPTVSVFGYSDDEAFAVGLTCGGTLKILIEPEVVEPYPLIANLLRQERNFVRVTVVSTNDAEAELIQRGEISSEGINAYEVSGALPPVGATVVVADGEVLFSNLEGNLTEVLIRDASALLDAGATTVRHYGRNGQAKLSEVEVLFETFAPPPRMIIFGAVDFTASLARLAKMLGFRVSVCDARPLFATKARFPMADEVVVDWPDRFIASVASTLSGRDAICVLTHDPKFDVPAITAALKTQVGYIGAMGSRRTHDERTKRLCDAGVGLTELESRVYGPIGLDIGARTPEETAVSILGEVIANRSRRFASSLSRGDGPIHNR